MIVNKLHVWVNPMVLSQAEREKLIDHFSPVEIVYEPHEFDCHYYDSNTRDLVILKDDYEISRIVRGMYARVELMAQHDVAAPNESPGGEPVTEPQPDEFYGDQAQPEQPVLEMLRHGVDDRETVPPSPYERFRHPLTEGKVVLPAGTGEVLYADPDDRQTRLMPVVPPDADATQILDLSIPDLGAPRELFKYWPGVGRHYRDTKWLRLW